MTPEDQRYLPIGKFGKPYGLQGWLKVYGNTERDIAEYRPWYIQEGRNWRAVEVTAVEQRGRANIAHIEGVDTPEAVVIYTNKIIGVLRDSLSQLPEHEYYWTDLEGLTVINQEDIVLGTIDYLFETGANDVMVVVGERRHMLPFLPGQVVLDVNLQEKVMRVDWDAEF